MDRSISKRRRRFLAFLAALPVGLLGARSHARPRQLNLTCFYAPETYQAKGAQFLADRIARDSSGAIQVSIEWEILMPLDEATVGTSALMAYCAPCVAKAEPLLNLSMLPMLAATFEETATLHRVARPYYSAALARHGQVLLATQPWLPGALWSNFPIRSVADLKGIAVAVAASPGASHTESGWGRPFARLGAAQSVSLAGAEVILASSYSGHTLKLAQEFAYFTEIIFATHVTFLAARQDVFDSLPEAEQRILRGAGRDTELAMWKLMSDQLLRRQQEIAALGVRVVARPPADLLAAIREAAQPDIQAWARSVGADGSAVLADYYRAIGQSATGRK